MVKTIQNKKRRRSYIHKTTTQVKRGKLGTKKGGEKKEKTGRNGKNEGEKRGRKIQMQKNVGVGARG